MARLEVIQIQCDRCKRVELRPPAPPKEKADFESRLFDKTLKYGDLCTWCQSTIERLWEDIREWQREVKQSFGPTVPENKAVPLTPAPDYTPPKPHSISALSKK